MTSSATTTRRLLASLLVVAAAACRPIDAAFVSSPMPATITSRVPFPSISHHNDPRRPRSQQQPLFVVADHPSREEEKKKKKSADDDDSWVATSSGGFLPKIPRVLREKLGRGAASSSSSSSPPLQEPPRKQKVNTKPEEVLTIQEYKAIVADETTQMVCVRFYAPWCRACKAVQQPFRKLCREHPSVKFVEVPLTKENAFLHEGLGIPSLPYGHIYHPQAGLVEERKINLKKKEFATFEQALKTYIEGECHVDYPEAGEGGVVCQPAN